jgi:tRNA-2-methylthio-N6-dimethylallyladenosine synthase
MSKESKGYKNMPKKIYIRTFGCQMNERDSEIVAGSLGRCGYEFTQRIEEADVIIFNTCSVRQHAEERVFGRLGQLRKLKEKKPDVILGVMGCMGQRYKEEIFERLPHVNFVCGTGNIYEIGSLIQQVLAGMYHVAAVDKDDRPVDVSDSAVRGQRKTHFKAFVTIMEGCNNFCSYCIVPYVRGRERSRKADDIINEIKGLVDEGCKEVALLGQNVNSYGKDPAMSSDFVRVLERIDTETGIKRVRFLTSHPKDVSSRLFSAMSDLPSVCEHLHLPIQSGSDRILRLMNRGYSSTEYLRLVHEYRQEVKDGSISTDVIVGFPSETDDDFNKTCEAVQKAGYESGYVFKYSTRTGTEASKMSDDVPLRVTEERNQRLLGMLNKLGKKAGERMLGKAVEVLVEGVSKRAIRTACQMAAGEPGCSQQCSYNVGTLSFRGKTRTGREIVFPGSEELTGQIVEVKITGMSGNTLVGWQVREVG